MGLRRSDSGNTGCAPRAHGLRVDRQHSSSARDANRAGVGERRSNEPARPGIGARLFHDQGRERATSMRFVSQRNRGPSRVVAGWAETLAPGRRFGVRDARAVPTHRACDRIARPRAAANRVRKAKTEASSGGIIRAGAKAGASEVPTTHWAGDIRNRRGHSRCMARHRTTPTLARDYTRQLPRPGCRRRRGNRLRHSPAQRLVECFGAAPAT